MHNIIDVELARRKRFFKAADGHFGVNEWLETLIIQYCRRTNTDMTV